MLSTLYTLFIAPLELFMSSILSASHSWLDSWGWAIVAMSLVVNTVILPIYNKAESWQEEERAVRRGFEAREAMIKRTFKGQERFAMLSTMRRQAGFTPLLAMRSSVGFLLQIPFFIAAYHLLSHWEPLKGVAFGPIPDLGAADGLLFGLNLLPILMTVVNLLSAFIYTASLTRQDKIQLYLLSALFLVLLYASPAALTLYWTLNNVYSLGKNIVEKSLLPAFEARRGETFASAAYKRFLGQVPSRRSVWILIAAAVVLFLAAVAIGAWCWKGWRGARLAPPAPLLQAFLLLLCSASALLWWGIRRYAFSSRRLDLPALDLLGSAVSIFVVLFGLFTTFAVDLSGWRAVLNTPPAVVKIYGWSLVWSTAPSALVLLHLALEKRLPERAESFGRLFLPGVFCASALLFLALPTLVLVSDPGAVSAPLSEVFAFEALGAAAALLVGALLRSLFRPRLRGVVAVGLLTAVVAAVLYAFIFVGDYGFIMDGVLDNPPVDKVVPKDALLDAAILAALLAVVLFILLRRRADIAGFARGFAGLSGIFFAGAFAAAGLAPSLVSEPAQNMQEVRFDPPESEKALMSFSKEKNVVHIVFDMFTGDNFPVILEMFPELKRSFEGFVWYKDVVAAGSGTSYGLAAATGGPGYIPRNVNARASEGKRFDAIYGESYAVVPNALPDDWNVTISGTIWPMELARFRRPPAAIEPYGPLAQDWFNYYYREGLSEAVGAESENAFMLLFSISAFKAAPYALRGKIYRSGAWLLPERTSTDGFRAEAPLRALAERSRIDETLGNAYRYFYFDSSHTGMYYDVEGRPSGKKPVPSSAWLKANPSLDYAHLLAEAASVRRLAEWLDWLRKEGIYDRTRIVVTSDHGAFDSPTLVEAIGLVPLRGREPEKKNNTNPGFRYGILITKDFNAKGEIRTDADALAATYDAPAFVLEGIAPVPDSLKADIRNPNRVRHYESSTDRDLGKSELKIFRYDVRGSMFKAENWTILDQ